MFSVFRNIRPTSDQPMKLQILSDLHIEFTDFELPQPETGTAGNE
jgi:hypothetical protein